MQNKYVGDIGDYFKYGLLRQLAGDNTFRLGVIWYLYTDPCKETDGLHLDYLGDRLRDRFRPCDADLYDKLGLLVQENARSVHAIDQRAILPAGTCFHATPLSLSGLPKGNAKSIAIRLAHRRRWLEQGLEATKDADLIFFDPDNGLEVKSTAAHHDTGPKFCFYDELVPFWARGQSLVIYQHCNRSGKVAEQIKSRISALQERLPGATITSLYFPAYTGRILLVAAQPDHAREIESRLDILRDRWREHIHRH